MTTERRHPAGWRGGIRPPHPAAGRRRSSRLEGGAPVSWSVAVPISIFLHPFALRLSAPSFSLGELHGRDARGEFVECREVGVPDGLELRQLFVDRFRQLVADGDLLRGGRPVAVAGGAADAGQLVIERGG